MFYDNTQHFISGEQKNNRAKAKAALEHHGEDDADADHEGKLLTGEIYDDALWLIDRGEMHLVTQLNSIKQEEKEWSNRPAATLAS